MLGSHLSIAGGLVNALLEARRLRLDCVQVFTKNQRQWSARPLAPSDRDAWLAELDRLGWNKPGEWRTVSHNSYLVNLASADAELRRRSLASQRDELERCEALHIPGCVLHPGAHLDPEARPPRSTPPAGVITRGERAGLDRVVKALDALHKDLPGYRTLSLLETTAGSGTALGYDFTHLAYIREHVREPERVGFCFDTCHVVSAGYDMSTPAAAEAVWQHWEATCGLRNIRAFHLNDSVGALGSHVDRHAHIGDGCCGKACFQSILNHAAFAAVPKILETPKGVDARGRPWDLVNIQRLRRMARSASGRPAGRSGGRPRAGRSPVR